MAPAKEVLVCMKCGSGNLDSNPSGVYSAQTVYGMSGAMSGQVLCNNCGNYGFPILLKHEKEMPIENGDAEEKTVQRIKHEKSVFIAVFASMIIVGAGQAYCGRLKRGIALFALGILAYFLMAAVEVMFYRVIGAGSILAFALPAGIWLANVIDAYGCAKGKPIL